jgi:hypothetical protein
MLPDNGQAGRGHAAQVRRVTAGVAHSVRVVELPGLTEKGDVSHWLAASGTVEAVLGLAQACGNAESDHAGEADVTSPAVEIDITILRLNRRPPPPLPLAVFGASWWDWIGGAAKAACCPPDYIAAPLLASASALIVNARWARAWPGWDEPPHLMARRGGRQRRWQDARHARPVRACAARIGATNGRGFPGPACRVEASRRSRQATRKPGRKKSQKLKAKRSMPPRPDGADVDPQPQEPRLKLHDVTIEKVGSVLNDTCAPKGLLMVRDELAGWLLGMNTYNDSARAPSGWRPERQSIPSAWPVDGGTGRRAAGTLALVLA